MKKCNNAKDRETKRRKGEMTTYMYQGGSIGNMERRRSDLTSRTQPNDNHTGLIKYLNEMWGS